MFAKAKVAQIRNGLITRWCSAWAALFALVLAVGSAACGGEVRRAPMSPSPSGPAWADLWPRAPDLYVVLRPGALRADPLYGAFFRALLRAAQARGVARGDTMVQAVQGADEIIVGLDPGGDAAVVFRGVPARLDPEKITDAEGRPLFRPVSRGPTRFEYELVGDRSRDMGALFVLPERTWVGTLGGACARARRAFDAPAHRLPLPVEPEALVTVRMGGRLARGLDPHPALRTITRRLSYATLSLQPGRGGLVVRLSYLAPNEAVTAARGAEELLAEWSKQEGREWLRAARPVQRGRDVVMRFAIPPRLLEELPHTSGSDLGL